MNEPDAVITSIAARQHSCFSRSQARAAGLSNKQIRHRITIGRWHEPFRDSFRIAGSSSSPEASILSAVLALPGCYASFESTAYLWAMTPRHGLVHLTRLHGSSHRLSGVTLHQTRLLPAHHVTTVGGIPATTRSRTLCDLAATWSDESLGDAVDRQLMKGTLRIDQLTRTYQDLVRPGRPGMLRMARVLDARLTAPGRSELERRFDALCIANDLPRGQTEYPAPWRTEEDPAQRAERVDVAYEPNRVIVELDGRAYHSSLAAFSDDRRRDHAALLAGWRTIRFSWSQVVHEPTRVADVVRAALSLESDRPPRRGGSGAIG